MPGTGLEEKERTGAMLAVRFELHGVGFQTVFTADIGMSADLACFQDRSRRQYNPATHVCVPDI
jgi:hypothetical protein